MRKPIDVGGGRDFAHHFRECLARMGDLFDFFGIQFGCERFVELKRTYEIGPSVKKVGRFYDSHQRSFEFQIYRPLYRPLLNGEKLKYQPMNSFVALVP